MIANKKKYLNLGCGKRYFTEWINVDFISSGKNVIAHNLNLGIPFRDNKFEVVYHSHILEHFEKKQAIKFLQECYRVMQPNGIIRIVVPDLEQIAKQYIQQLEIAKKNSSPKNNAKYEWAMIELYDQVVRNSSGGEMSKFWSVVDSKNDEWLIERMGEEYLNYKMTNQNSVNQSVILNKSKYKWYNYFKFSKYRRLLFSYLIGEPNLFELIELSKFKTSGEIHQWMYDSYSLSQILNNIGFKEINKVDAFQSNIENWEEYQWLDIENGNVRKPDSLFIEAKK